MRFNPGCGCCETECFRHYGVFSLVNNQSGSWTSGVPILALTEAWEINGQGLKYTDLTLDNEWLTTVQVGFLAGADTDHFYGNLSLCWNGSGLSGRGFWPENNGSIISTAATTYFDEYLEQQLLPLPPGNRFGVEVTKYDTVVDDYIIRILGGYLDENNYYYLELGSFGYDNISVAKLGQKIDGVDTVFSSGVRRASYNLSLIQDFFFGEMGGECGECGVGCCGGPVPNEITVGLNFTGSTGDLLSNTFYSGICEFDFNFSDLNGTYVVPQTPYDTFIGTTISMGDQVCVWSKNIFTFVEYQATCSNPNIDTRTYVSAGLVVYKTSSNTVPLPISALRSSIYLSFIVVNRVNYEYVSHWYYVDNNEPCINMVSDNLTLFPSALNGTPPDISIPGTVMVSL